MKKIWIVFSSAIMTGIFLYAMSFISSKNTCTWVRIYECTALQKQQALVQQEAEQLAQQQAAALQAQQTINQPVATQEQAAASKVNTRTRAS